MSILSKNIISATITIQLIFTCLPVYSVGDGSSNIIGSIQSNDINAKYSITAKNSDTGLTRTIEITASEKFRFSQLPIGRYEIIVKYKETIVARDSVNVSLGGNTVARFDLSNLQPGDMEEVTVVGIVESADLYSTDQGLVLAEAEIDVMPVARNLTAISLLAPGVIEGDSGFGVNGDDGYASFGGSSISENSCYINGLEVTNTRQGLGCGSVPFEFYKQFQVKTGGYSAQFGRTTGGVLNAVTKSGGNEWEFSFTSSFSPDGLKGEGNVSQAHGSTGAIFRDTRDDELSQYEYTFSASGPILEDKLFMYTIINPRDKTQSFSSYSGASRNSADSLFRSREASGSDNLFWGTKIDWDINNDHRLSYFGYSNRRDDTEKVFSRNPNTRAKSKLQSTNIRKRGGEAHSISYTGHITDNLTVSAMHGTIETQYENIVGNQDCFSVNDTRDNPLTPAVGCGPGGSKGANFDDNTQTRLDIEFIYANHSVRFGYDYQDRQSTREVDDVGGHRYTYTTYAPGATIQGNNGEFYTNNTGQDIDIVSDRSFVGGGGFSSELTAFYIEDNWQLTDNLVLNLGLRKDTFKNIGTTGITFVDIDTDIAPRLGFSWDPTGSGTYKVYGTWGRYYLPIPNNTNYRAAAGITDMTTHYTFTGIDSSNGGPLGITQVLNIVNSLPVAPSVETFQAKEADPFYKDETIIGFATQLNDEYTASIKAIYRNVGSALDDYCGDLASPASCTLLNPGKSGTWSRDVDGDGQADPGSRRTYSAAEIGLPEGKNKYIALQPQINYASDKMRWSLIYVWSRSTGNFEGAVKSDINQSDAGVTQDFDFPALMDGAEGYQANDRRHVFKFFGSYYWTDHLTLGWKATLSSGRPLSTFGRGYPNIDPHIYGSYGDTFYLTSCPDTNNNGNCDDAEETFTRTPRGSAGRTPWLFSFDLSANYHFIVSGIDMNASLDIFNLLDNTEVTSSNEHYEISQGKVSQYYGAAYTWQSPRSVRFGLEARF